MTTLRAPGVSIRKAYTFLLIFHSILYLLGAESARVGHPFTRELGIPPRAVFPLRSSLDGSRLFSP